MLDTRWLEDFLAIANTRSFKRAAEIRNVSQSGLSRRVQSLEQWAGTGLVDRNAVPLELTEAGRDLLPVATMVLSGLAQLRHKIADRVNQDKKLLRLTAPHILSATFFPDWLPRVSQIGGGSEIVVVSQNLLGCFEALDRGDVHFIVCLADKDRTTFKRIPEALRVDPEMIAKVGEDRLIAVSVPKSDGSPRYRLATPGTPLLQYTPECSLGWPVENILLNRPELAPRRLATNPFADGLRLMVANGVGVAWLPESLIARELQAGSMVRAGDPDLDVPMEVLVIRPVHRLSDYGERIWQSLSEGAQLGGKVAPPQLHLIN
jgi:DNA-binding transcriptional LysR family regulator